MSNMQPNNNNKLVKDIELEENQDIETQENNNIEEVATIVQEKIETKEHWSNFATPGKQNKNWIGKGQAIPPSWGSFASSKVDSVRFCKLSISQNKIKYPFNTEIKEGLLYIYIGNYAKVLFSLVFGTSMCDNIWCLKRVKYYKEYLNSFWDHSS